MKFTRRTYRAAIRQAEVMVMEWQDIYKRALIALQFDMVLGGTASFDRPVFRAYERAEAGLARAEAHLQRIRARRQREVRRG